MIKKQKMIFMYDDNWTLADLLYDSVALEQNDINKMHHHVTHLHRIMNNFMQVWENYHDTK